jgi:hypothetical protein
MYAITEIVMKHRAGWHLLAEELYMKVVFLCFLFFLKKIYQVVSDQRGCYVSSVIEGTHVHLDLRH